MKDFIKVSAVLQILVLSLCIVTSPPAFSEEKAKELEYIRIDPVIITNYHKKTSKKPGFIQMAAQLSVTNKASVDLVNQHMPLIRDFIIEFLSFTDEQTIKDVKQRNQLRKELSSGIQKMLTKQLGDPLIEELVITHFMWN